MGPSNTVTINSDGTVEYQLVQSEPTASNSSTSFSSQEWTLVDTETTGLWAPIYVVELAAQRFSGLTPIGDPFHAYINHDVEIPAIATAVHGHTTEYIRANGQAPGIVYSSFRDYVGDSYVSAHYLIYDWDQVLIPELKRLGEPPIGQRGFCTWFLSRRSLPEFKTHKLDYLRDVFTLNCCRPHTAKGDVESVTDLLSRVIFPRLGRIGMGELPPIVEFSRLRPLALCRQKISGVEMGVDYKDIPYTPPGMTDEALAAKRRYKVKAEADRLNQQLKEFAQRVLSGNYSYPRLITEYHMIEETPDVLFKDEVFVFTGTMRWGSRSQAEKEIVARGGLMYKTKAMSAIDYLVLGEDPEAGWLSGLYDRGAKLGNAFTHKFVNPDSKLKIILERDFIAAL